MLLCGLLAAAPLPSAYGQATTQAAAAAAPVLPPFLRTDLYPRWIDAQAQVNWPPHDGFAADPVGATLQPGTLIDRFGSEGGRFFSPKGDSFAARALPYVCRQMAYTVYRVMQPLQVMAGKAAPWFGEPGGATQYQTVEPAYKLRAAGAIEVVQSDSPGDGKPAPQCGSP